MSYTREEFVIKYGGFISKAVKGSGLFQGTCISQAILESQGKVGGVWRVGASKLSREANNYFGIKCSSSWKGKVYNIDTGEETKTGEKYIEKNACFRAYASVEESILDWIKFLQENPRYEKAGVFKANSVSEQFEALKRGGYATSTTYVTTLNGVFSGIKDIAQKYSRYGLKGIIKSFAVSPIKFVKRNKVETIFTLITLTGLTLTTIYLIKKRK